MNIVISLYSPIQASDKNTIAVLSFYESVIKVLSEQGHRIFVHVTDKFSANYLDMPKQLCDELKEFKPDLFILFNNTFYEIPSCFECPIVVWEVDSPRYYSNKNAIRRNSSRYKFLVCQEESIRELNELYGIDKHNVVIIPFFTEIRAENIQLQTNIVFIGSYFGGTNPFAEFQQTNPSQQDVEWYRNILLDYTANQNLKLHELKERNRHIPEHFFQNINLVRWENCYSNFNRIKTLSAIADLGLTIYGTKTWITGNYLEPWLTLSYNPQLVYSLKHNQDIYNSAKIGININHLQAQSGFSWRVCDIMASNACLVSEYRSNFAKYFPNVNLPTYDTPYDAWRVCKKLLTDESYRLDIVHASQAAIDKNFRFKHAQLLIEQFLGISFAISNSTTENPNIIYRREARPSFMTKLRMKLAKLTQHKKNL